MPRTLLTISLLALGLTAASAHAAIINVPADHATIQGAINAAAVSGDEIIVAPGTYPELINFNGKAIDLHSASGNPADTIIDGTGLGDSVVLCISGEGSGTIMEGFTITGGATGHNDGFGTLSGGGMYNQGSSPTITNCLFRGNSVSSNGGGGMFNNSSHPSLTNCIFSGNTAQWGGGLYNISGSNPMVTNCSFSGNTAINDGGGMLNQLSSHPTLTNCILWGDSLNEIVNFDPGSTTTISFSNVLGGIGVGSIDGGGNLDLNPFFIDADGADNLPGTPDDDLRLSDFSPGTDAGDNTATGLFGITTDLDGNSRFYNDLGVADTGVGLAPIVDMGAYERQVDSVFTTTSVPGDFTTIQGAIDVASVIGYEIIVAPGTYSELINFSGKAVYLHSASGNPADTIIDGAGLGSVVHCVSGEGPGTILEGFTITGGNSSKGGGMKNFNSSSPTITNCTFSGNTATSGGGMSNFNSSSPTITNCTFSGNLANFIGGGMYNFNSSSPTITNCTFSGNLANNQGGGIINTISSPIITNCIFSGNTAINDGGGMLNNSSSHPIITNCIFWGDSLNEIVNFDAGSTTTISFSNVQGGIGAGSVDGGGNLDLDPLFIDADGADNLPGTLDDDLRLASISPCTDAGDNAALGLVGITTDLDEFSRFFDDLGVANTGNGIPGAPIVDMGAYERQANSLFIVPTDFPTIQLAINAAFTGAEIIVAPGTYPELINFIGKAVYLHSASGNPADTIIDGTGLNESVVLCISGEGPGTILEGFTITGGATGHNDGFGTLSGGGMFNEGSSPTVINCIFRGNSVSSNGGGGMFNNSSSPTITNCIFSGNTAQWGGGLYNNFGSNPLVTNCSFSGNTAINDGGGMLNQLSSHPTITNCIFWADSLNEIVNFDPGSTTTISFSNVLGGIRAGSIDGGGNLDLDPLFIDADGIDNIPGTPDDDLRLSNFSPCTDAGDNTATGLIGITTDLEGNPRYFDDLNMSDTGNGVAPIVDMGAYERQVDSVYTTISVPGDFATIQGAIDAAAVSEYEIIVAPGTYPELINFNGKTVYLHSASGNPADTIIDGTGLGNSVVQCVSGEGPGTILEGFTIRGGNVFTGGGMLNNNSNPTITNCTFSGNTATIGGGMYNGNSSNPTITNCTFSGNTAGNTGGGMYNISGSNPTLTNCTFSGNTATNGNGGGMYNIGSNPTITNCTFSGNTAGNDGGGMYNGTAPNNSPFVFLTITNCTFSGNTAGSNGGGMFNSTLTADNPVVFITLTNCTFSGNTATNGNGGGMFNIVLEGVFLVTRFTNCIFWADSPNEILNAGSLFISTISFSNVQGGLPFGSTDGGGNIDLDPLFIDADGIDNIPGTLDDNLRLSDFSPCTDAGDSFPPSVSGFPPPLFGITTDLDGNPRFYDDLGVADTGIGPAPIVDMGAYERQVDSSLPCPADITPPGGNSVVNIDDLVAVLNGFGPCPAPPSPCPADITPPGGNGAVNIDDLVAVLNAFGLCP